MILLVFIKSWITNKNKNKFYSNWNTFIWKINLSKNNALVIYLIDWRRVYD